jgi:hypothetical protein
MSDNNGNCCTKEIAEAAFNELIKELGSVVDHASYNADAYKNKVNKLDDFVLNCEMETDVPAGSCKAAPEPNTVLYKLRAIINQLKASNEKNDEILKHFNTLV